MATPPDRTEAADFYFTYIDRVPSGDILHVLDAQRVETLELLGGISEDRSRYRYAHDKWSIREVLGHVNDTERVFAFRAFWFARGLEGPLPNFDQTVAAPRSGADEREWHGHVEEFSAIRAATLALFTNLPPDAWSRRGVASGHPVTVRALAYIAAGHVAHHLGILRDRYLSRPE